MSRSSTSVLPASASRRATGASLRSWLSFSRISGLYVWAVIFVIFALWIPETFLTRSTWQDIAGSNAIVAIAGIGLLLPLAAGAYDLSIGQMIGASSMLAAWLAHHGMGTTSIILLTLVFGVAGGILNGTLVVLMRIDSFIATLGTSAILLAFTEAISNGEAIVGIPESLGKLGTTQVGGVPIDVVYLAVLAIVAWYVLQHTPFGRYLYAIGGGREAARLAGINARLYLFLSLVVCSLVASCAGIIVTAQLGTGQPNIGPPYLLPVFAAAFLGATQILPGRFNVVGLLIANYLLATGSKGLQLAGASFWVTDLFNGLVLILAVGLSGVATRPRILSALSRRGRGTRPPDGLAAQGGDPSAAARRETAAVPAGPPG